MEVYKDIEGYECYKISNYGNVKSLNYLHTHKEKLLKTVKDCNGYLVVGLCKQGKSQNHYVHRLVAKAFIDNPNKLPEINHKDEDKTNNHVTNLEWCDRKYNINYGTHTERSTLSRSKQVMCVETGVVYPSLCEAARQLNLKEGDISRCCNGIRNTCGGFHWSFLDQEIGYN